MDKCLWVCAGYPPLIAAIVALWKVYQKERRETRNAELKLLEEKDRRVHELEAFHKILEQKLRQGQGGSHGGKPF